MLDYSPVIRETLIALAISALLGLLAGVSLWLWLRRR